MLNNYNKYSFIKTNILKDPHSGINITTLSNFKVNNGSEFTHYKGLFFPIKYYVHYGNLLDYYIGGYLQLKKIYPELQIIFFKSQEDFINSTNLRNEFVVKDFIEYFDAEVLDIDNNSYYFDAIIVNDPESPVVPYDMYTENKNVCGEFSTETISWRLNSTKILFEEFKHRLVKDEKKKIYVTRSFINKEYLNSNHDWSTYRKHDILYDEYLDNLFTQNNFTVVEFSNKGFFEQINIAYNAKEYVGIDGGSLVNAVWCEPDTKIIRIQINKKYTEYNYYWDKNLGAVGNKLYSTIDVTTLDPKKAIQKIFYTLNSFNI